MKFAFYITGTSGRLTKFLNQSNVDIIKQIKIVIADKSIPEELEALLTSNDINYVFIDYSSLSGINNKEKNLQLSNKMLELLDANRIDYMFSFGGHILSGQLLDKYRNRLINFHPAILPMYPGARSIDQAVNHGNTLLVGNTAHFIDEGLDSGMIIMQSVTPLQAFLDTNDYDIVLDHAVEMLTKLIALLNEERIIIEENRVRILGANYNKSHIYPEIM